MFFNSNSSVEDFDNTLTNESSIMYNDETIVSNKLWTLKFKPPTYNDALNFINKFKNTHYNKQFQFKYNNVIENIRKNLLSISIPVGCSSNFFASENNIILEPLKQPPSYLMAFKWLETYNSKNKRKQKCLQNNKRKGFMTPESLTKSILLKRSHQTSTPNSSKEYNSSLFTPNKKKCKSLKSKRKLSTLFLDSLNVRNIVIHLY